MAYCAGVKQKEGMMATVCLEKRGDFYMAFHQDARDIYQSLPDVVLLKSGGADAVSVPAHDLERTVSTLNNNGISVKIRC